MTDPPLVAGIDLATADARVTVATADGQVVARTSAPLPAPQRPRPGWSEQDPRTWWPAVARCLREAAAAVEGPIEAVSVSATSGTVVLAGADGEPVGPALLYDDRRAPAPQRWAWLAARPGAGAAAHAWHAADVVVAGLVGRPPPTDWTTALKTGFDPETRSWSGPGPGRARRPPVQAPGTLAGRVDGATAAETGLPPGCPVNVGMTDGCAAQVAAGADRPGRFVTVLGTTMVVKGGSPRRIDDPASGVYSHLHPGGWWLPGGASNVGAGALAARFPASDLAHLDRRAAEHGPARVACYPLTDRGERFPFACDDAGELWTGEPADDVERYRAVLEGVAFVERLAYERLDRLGAAAGAPLLSAGGGGRSAVWSAIRATVLGRPVAATASADSGFGACVLAAAGTVHADLAAASAAMVGPAGPATDPVEAEAEQLDAGYRSLLAELERRGWLAPAG